MSRKESLLTFLAIVFGVCLTGIGGYLIFMAVWGFTKLGFEPQVRFFAFMFSVFGALFLIAGILLVLMKFRVHRKILPILAVIFGVCLTGMGAYLIFLAVWDYAKFGFDPERVLAFMFSVFGALFLIGGILLLRAYRGTKKSRGDS